MANIPELPNVTYDHCSIAINKSSVMVIGGFLQGSHSSKTYVYNLNIHEWTPGPELKYSRSDHACASILLNGKYR